MVSRKPSMIMHERQMKAEIKGKTSEKKQSLLIGDRDLDTTKSSMWGQYIHVVWCRRDSPGPWVMQLPWIHFLSCFLYSVLLSVSLSLHCFQVLVFHLTRPIWDLWRLHHYKSGHCDCFSTRCRVPWGTEKLCQQMWFVCSASPEPSREAVQARGGPGCSWRNGPWSLPQPLERILRCCCCRVPSVARTDDSLQPQRLSWEW